MTESKNSGGRVQSALELRAARRSPMGVQTAELRSLVSSSGTEMSAMLIP